VTGSPGSAVSGGEAQQRAGCSACTLPHMLPAPSRCCLPHPLAPPATSSRPSTPWHRPPGQVCGTGQVCPSGGQVCGAAQVWGCPAGRPSRSPACAPGGCRAHGPRALLGASPEGVNAGLGLRQTRLACRYRVVPGLPECARMGQLLAEPRTNAGTGRRAASPSLRSGAPGNPPGLCPRRAAGDCPRVLLKGFTAGGAGKGERL